LALQRCRSLYFVEVTTAPDTEPNISPPSEKDEKPVAEKSAAERHGFFLDAENRFGSEQVAKWETWAADF